MSEKDARPGLLGETYLGESEVDRRAVGLLAGLLDSLREDARAAEVRLSSTLVSHPATQKRPSYDTYPNLGLELSVGTRDVLAALDGLAHARVDRLPVGAAEHGTSAKERKRVVLRARIVDSNVPEHVLRDLLGEVDVDTEEVRCARKL